MRLFDQMAKAGVPRDRVTYNAAVRACERGAEYKLAMDLRMAASGALSPMEGGEGQLDPPTAADSGDDSGLP